MALDAFMKIDGIAGEAKDSDHKEWIEITGYSFGNTQPTTLTATSAGGATSGRTQLADFHVSKRLDFASVKLFGESCAGKHIKEVTIAVHRAGGEKLKYFEIVLEEVIISSYTQIAQDGIPLESIQFNYGRIKTTYTQQRRSDGGEAGNVAAGWDQIANKQYA
ncbi:type VI secretion system tube protein Hcp [Pseudomonas baltica]|uniref:Hcp family type VI secretion system effector n=1 Tax=Pseudomonas baltica TaxID=2762576 RepID=UPI0028981E99|nr:type VI secretion system tube protein Hcp [Pseudomonas baltica]